MTSFEETSAAMRLVKLSNCQLLVVCTLPLDMVYHLTVYVSFPEKLKEK